VTTSTVSGLGTSRGAKLELQISNLHPQPGALSRRTTLLEGEALARGTNAGSRLHESEHAERGLAR
jgi:hypothetical protein